MFAPTNAAFAKLPAGTVDGLLKPAAEGRPRQVLTYHVVPGNDDRRELAEAIKAGEWQGRS